MQNETRDLNYVRTNLVDQIARQYDTNEMSHDIYRSVILPPHCVYIVAQKLILRSLVVKWKGASFR